MKNLIIVFILISLYSCGTQKASVTEIANAKPIILYETTKDFVNDNPMQLKASAIIRNESNKHFTIKKIIDPISGMKIKRGISAWSIKYKGNNYFNLGYSGDLNHWKSYAKFDIEGRICAIIIDENSPNVLKTNGTYYGGGLTGVLIGESTKWGKSWKDKKGNRKKILFIDTKRTLRKNAGRNPGSLGNYLTRKQLKELIKNNNIKVDTDRIKDISFEKVIEIIEMINSK